MARIKIAVAGESADVKGEWVDYLGLIPNLTGPPCILRLAGIQTCPRHYLHGPGTAGTDCQPVGASSHLYDHASLWDRDGKPSMFVLQPYGLEYEEVQMLSRLCDYHGLEFRVGTLPGWHYPGYVLMIEVYRKGEPWVDGPYEE